MEKISEIPERKPLCEWSKEECLEAQRKVKRLDRIEELMEQIKEGLNDY